jgi:acetyl/propionyl-CoA carboxylase alpha subunit
MKMIKVETICGGKVVVKMSRRQTELVVELAHNPFVTDKMPEPLVMNALDIAAIVDYTGSLGRHEFYAALGIYGEEE